ncbi:glycoprotein 3-alpha-L-fucosyltransferase A-like [Hibiscus syriacus]|uniref:glycoprotein 3-alpha-L-fucosyltransferase A-like n=1 Tax=Hibiscus syriacus TaxID=106335 RepID=UPI001923DD3B|nr:glycoprotein 3-alpha-L-fucosyltransferase A-like [Hibiscus syriacus]
MGIVPYLRGARTHEGLPIAEGLSHSTSASNDKKWLTLMPLLLALLVIAEIGFLGRFRSLPAMFRESRSSGRLKVGGARNFWIRALGGHRNLTCEEWLEREDVVVYSRNFSDDPILVYHQKQPTIPILISLRHDGGVGYEYVMTTSLSSDVPVGYFSWAEYDIMAPVLPKTKKALAAAFISNCEARNFRIKALVRLENENIKIDSYGRCHRNRNENVDKVKALKHYKFSLAFENSNEEDYVTEKFFQSLVAGSVPVVVGAPNIEDFAPSPGSYLHIKELEDVGSVAERMKYLSENQDAYNESLRWKYEGPSDSFKALLDMAAVHSSCRLCIHLATIFRQDEEKNPDVQKRPCKCEMGSETLYHLYVRERGRFEMDSIFLRSGNMTLEALEASVLMHFKTRKHEPIWKWERPESIRGGELKVYRIYPIGLTQRQALYTFKFKDDADLRNHIENNPCAKFEVIFV